MHLSFQDLITVTPYYLAFLIMSSIDLNLFKTPRLVWFFVHVSMIMSHMLINHHWLPIQYRIQFKILLMTFKVLCGEAPSYLCDLITPYVPTHILYARRTNYFYTSLVSILRLTDSVYLRHLPHAFGMICLTTLKARKI